MRQQCRLKTMLYQKSLYKAVYWFAFNFFNFLGCVYFRNFWYFNDCSTSAATSFFIKGNVSIVFNVEFIPFISTPNIQNYLLCFSQTLHANLPSGNLRTFMVINVCDNILCKYTYLPIITCQNINVNLYTELIIQISGNYV
jgi:hypothetical protein